MASSTKMTMDLVFISDVSYGTFLCKMTNLQNSIMGGMGSKDKETLECVLFELGGQRVGQALKIMQLDLDFTDKHF
jgi:hypothetical protein